MASSLAVWPRQNASSLRFTKRGSHCALSASCAATSLLASPLPSPSPWSLPPLSASGAPPSLRPGLRRPSCSRMRRVASRARASCSTRQRRSRRCRSTVSSCKRARRSCRHTRSRSASPAARRSGMLSSSFDSLASLVPLAPSFFCSRRSAFSISSRAAHVIFSCARSRDRSSCSSCFFSPNARSAFPSRLAPSAAVAPRSPPRRAAARTAAWWRASATHAASRRASSAAMSRCSAARSEAHCARARFSTAPRSSSRPSAARMAATARSWSPCASTTCGLFHTAATAIDVSACLAVASTSRMRSSMVWLLDFSCASAASRRARTSASVRFSSACASRSSSATAFAFASSSWSSWCMAAPPAERLCMLPAAPASPSAPCRPEWPCFSLVCA